MFDIVRPQESVIILRPKERRKVTGEIRESLSRRGFNEVSGYMVPSTNGYEHIRGLVKTNAQSEDFAFAELLSLSGRNFKQVLGLDAPPTLDEVKASAAMLGAAERASLLEWLRSNDK